MTQPARQDPDSAVEADRQPADDHRLVRLDQVNGKAVPGLDERVQQPLERALDAPLDRQPESAANGKAASGNGKDKPRYPRRHRRSKPQLKTLSDLDGRTNAARSFSQLVRAVEQDLGGADQLSTIERSLIEGFVGAAITTRSLNVRIALGQEVLPAEFSQCVSTMVRIANRLGIRRRTKDVPSLNDLLLENIEHEGVQDHEPDSR